MFPNCSSAGSIAFITQAAFHDAMDLIKNDITNLLHPRPMFWRKQQDLQAFGHSDQDP